MEPLQRVKALSKAFEISGVMMPIEAAEYLALLDFDCNPNRAVASPLGSQAIVGLATPAALQAKGTAVPAILQRPMVRHMHQMGLDSGSNTNGSEKTATYATAFSNAGFFFWGRRDRGRSSDAEMIEGTCNTASKYRHFEPTGLVGCGFASRGGTAELGCTRAAVRRGEI